MPLLIAFLAFLFNVVNGLINGLYFSGVKFDYDYSWLSTPQFIVGIIIFCTGFAINNMSDSYLISLRKGTDKGYVIPRKDFSNIFHVLISLVRLLSGLGSQS
ncbi:MAG: hypothetical protein CM15mP75_6170 [Flammeovirgaceae bacterium]|nr:MAG: hypothetical protein CM15mP75_6170 [Flammeovirgaceae bacterium]